MSRVRLVIPGTKSFGVAVIPPRRLSVPGSPSGTRRGDPLMFDVMLGPVGGAPVGVESMTVDGPRTLLTPFFGIVDSEKWAVEEKRRGTVVHGVPLAQHWLIPEDCRPRHYTAQPTMSLEQIRLGTQRA